MNPFRNDVLDEVVYHDSDVKLTPDMTRKFEKLQTKIFRMCRRLLIAM